MEPETPSTSSLTIPQAHLDQVKSLLSLCELSKIIPSKTPGANVNSIVSQSILEETLFGIGNILRTDLPRTYFPEIPDFLECLRALLFQATNFAKILENTLRIINNLCFQFPENNLIIYKANIAERIVELVITTPFELVRRNGLSIIGNISYHHDAIRQATFSSVCHPESGSSLLASFLVTEFLQPTNPMNPTLILKILKSYADFPGISKLLGEYGIIHALVYQVYETLGIKIPWLLKEANDLSTFAKTNKSLTLSPNPFEAFKKFYIARDEAYKQNVKFLDAEMIIASALAYSQTEPFDDTESSIFRVIGILESLAKNCDWNKLIIGDRMHLFGLKLIHALTQVPGIKNYSFDVLKELLKYPSCINNYYEQKDIDGAKRIDLLITTTINPSDALYGVELLGSCLLSKKVMNQYNSIPFTCINNTMAVWLRWGEPYLHHPEQALPLKITARKVLKTLAHLAISPTISAAMFQSQDSQTVTSLDDGVESTAPELESFQHNIPDFLLFVIQKIDDVIVQRHAMVALINLASTASQIVSLLKNSQILVILLPIMIKCRDIFLFRHSANLLANLAKSPSKDVQDLLIDTVAQVKVVSEDDQPPVLKPVAVIDVLTMMMFKNDLSIVQFLAIEALSQLVVNSDRAAKVILSNKKCCDQLIHLWTEMLKTISAAAGKIDANISSRLVFSLVRLLVNLSKQGHNLVETLSKDIEVFSTYPECSQFCAKALSELALIPTISSTESSSL